MNVYAGPFLSITLEKSQCRLTQHWNESPSNIDMFKSEMLQFISVFKKYKPKQVLWIQENMSIFIDNECKNWIEEHINIPALAENCLVFNDMDKIAVAFVIGKNLMSHIEVVDVFEGESGSCITPTHFTNEIDAIEWLEFSTTQIFNSNKINVEYTGIDPDGNLLITIRSSNVKQTLKTIKKVLNESDFITNNSHKYALLTIREKGVLKLYSKGNTHQEIANTLHISVHTVRTHWRNIKNKIGPISNKEAFTFAKAFNAKNTQ